MNRALAALLLLAFAAALPAAEDVQKLTRQYLSLKDSSDYYVGEGLAQLKEFDGDGLKALAAARERARANLAASVRVRIVSETKESAKAGTDGNSESIESKSASLADVVLENVRVEDFVGVPDKGQVTALALLSKADYRRQLAGKGPRVYGAEAGLKLGAFGIFSDSLGEIQNAGSSTPTDRPIANPNNAAGATGGSDNTPGYALEFFWQRWVLALHYYSISLPLYVFTPDTGLGHYERKDSQLGYHQVQLGYDWEPWATKFQPFIPLRLSLAHSDWEQYSAVAYGFQSGLGLRYWPNDSIAFELSGRWQFGFNSVEYQQNGSPLRLSPTKDATLNLTGAQIIGAIVWNSF